MKKNVKNSLLTAAGILTAVALVVAIGSAMRDGSVKATDTDIAQQTQGEVVPGETEVATDEIVVTAEPSEASDATQAPVAEETKETEATEETEAPTEEPTEEATEAPTEEPTEETTEATEPRTLSVKIRLEALEGEINYGKKLRLIAEIDGVPEEEVTYVWQYSLDGEKWENVPDAENAEYYDFILDETNAEYYWRVVANA